MSGVQDLDAAGRRRRRGVVKASITKLVDRVRDLERREELTPTDRLAAKRLQQRLTDMDGEFRTYHLSVVDLLDEEADLETEQAVLDEHDDRLTGLQYRLERLATPAEKEERRIPDPKRSLQRRLLHLEGNLRKVSDAVSAIEEKPDVDRCLLEQYDEQQNGFKLELYDISRTILSLDGDVSDLSDHEAIISKAIFDVCLKIRRLLHTPVPVLHRDGIKLPKIDVPTFDGDIMNWRRFWEQYEVSIHSRTSLTDPEKLAYLRQSLKDGPARHVIEGLSGSGYDYAEAIESLQKRYDKPRLLHHAHVKAIVDVPGLKEGNGRELRRLHDVSSQHLRALKAMGYDPSGPFVTSLIEMKLDRTTMFEWQRHTQETSDVPHYTQILEFIDLRARASETILREGPKRHAQTKTTYVANIDSACISCGVGKHPLYICKKFKSLAPEQRRDLVRKHHLCYNCLQSGHFTPQCVSEQRCQKCRRPHHTLLHSQFERDSATKTPVRDVKLRTSSAEPEDSTESHSSHMSSPNPGGHNSALLMTCQVAVVAPDGHVAKARALIDCASSTSFVTERMAQRLQLPRRRQRIQVAGIGGNEHTLSSRSVVTITIAKLKSTTGDKFSGPQWKVEAVVLPKIATKLPVMPVPFNPIWKHLAGLHLADPEFGTPGHIDILLGVDVFNQVVRQGRRQGPPGSPMAMNTCFGWVLSGTIRSNSPQHQEVSCLSSALAGDDLLRKFWEVENCDFRHPPYSLEERMVVSHFDANHKRDSEGRFIVPLPMKADRDLLGESRTMAVRRFLSMERSLRSKGKFMEFADAIDEYFRDGHAEPVPPEDLSKPNSEVFYLPMHAVCKDSTTTKLRVVFDASAKSSTGVSLNDQLLVGPTVHAPLLDVLMRFRRHQVALATDISRMYRAVLLPEDQRNLHRFVWRKNEREGIKDFRMTRLTFGVSASSFAANMAVKQNAIFHEDSYPRAASVVRDSFYVDDGLAGASSIPEAIQLQKELQELFTRGGFLLRKWKSNEPAALRHLPPHLVDQRTSLELPVDGEYTKVLGVEWSTELDSLRLAAGTFSSQPALTKRVLASNIARIYDILGWYSPSIIKVKVLLQQLWLSKLGWDDLVPSSVKQSWEKWQEEFPALHQHLIPRCYFPSSHKIVSLQLHGFGDASELAYGGVVYLRAIDTDNTVHVSLVIAKTKVAPIKSLSMPRLELCGAVITAKLLSHCRKVLDVPLSDTFAWTDSTVVLSWLRGNPRRFKPFVGNRVAEVMEIVPPDRWRHVPGTSNPADCASRGLYPSELVQHRTWWNGPSWLHDSPTNWPVFPGLVDKPEPCEEKASFEEPLEIGLVVVASELPLLKKISSYSRLRRVTAWVRRFTNNCRASSQGEPSVTGVLTSTELSAAENLWIASAQQSAFPNEVNALRKGKEISSGPLLAFHPFMDENGLMRVGGRLSKSSEPYDKKHQIILPGKHALTKLMVRSEHLKLLHAGPTLIAASLARQYAIIGARRAIRDVTRSCTNCKRVAGKPCEQLLGQLPVDRLRPGPVFDRVGVDYAGPVLIKSGHVRRPIVTKAYVCVFVAFDVKAVHLEPVSDLTSTAFIATLRRFIARRGKPSVIWSDHGTNFVGASREMKELHEFCDRQGTKDCLATFCSERGIQWRFIPEHAPHFGGLWEAAVKSFKYHFRRIVGDIRLTFEELTTTLAQIEACLNTRPLTPMPGSEEGIEALTPGHFLIGRPLESLPDPPSSLRPISLLRRWNLCQTLTRHFWKRWSAEYLNQLQQFGKWRKSSRNLEVGDVVCLRGEPSSPTRWPLARVEEVVNGEDGLVRVVIVRTAKGVYRRPVTKIVPLLREEN